MAFYLASDRTGVKKWLSIVALCLFVAVCILVPFITWALLFMGWNAWAVYAGWHVIIPVNWMSVLTAVAICWFIRALVCRK